MGKINPGEQSRTDKHYNPHGNSSTSAPHAGQGRGSAGTFNGGGGGAHMAPGGSQEHGNMAKSMFNKKGGSPKKFGGSGDHTGTSGNSNPALSKPYDSDGDDWL